MNGTRDFEGRFSYLRGNWRQVSFFIALLLPFYLPLGLIRVFIPNMTGVVFVAEMLSLVIVFAVGLREGRLDKFVGLAFLLAAIMFFCTAINGWDDGMRVYLQCFIDWAPVAAAALLVAVACQRRMVDLVCAVFSLTGVLAACNLISVLWLPGGFDVGGIDVVNFYGHKNISIDVILPAVLCSLILDRWEGRCLSKTSVVLSLIGFAQVLVSYSATSLVALAAFYSLCLLGQWRRFRSICNGIGLMAAYFVFDILIVVFKAQNLFSPILTGVLGKTTTFTSRTYVWEGALSLMTPDHLLLGYGGSARFGLHYNGLLYAHAHNFLLQVLISGGIAATIVYGALMSMTAFSLYQNRACEITGLLVAAVGCFLLVGLMEPLMNMTWPLLLALSYYWRESRDLRVEHCGT